MRFFHLSDLHIGRQLHYYNLKEDQEHMLEQIVEMAKKYHPDVILIAGDIYDKSVPSAEAVSVLNHFLTDLVDIEPSIPIMMIAGNHDSAQRLNYASSILDKQQLFISGMPPRTQNEFLKKMTYKDEYGNVTFYLLPFVKPGYVRNVFPDTEINSYEDAVKALIEREEVDQSQRNVILSHQFYTAAGTEPERRESEMVNVGGLDNVDVKVLEKFDYAALGHIHRGQHIGKTNYRYCGTPLKYSVSEENDEKYISLIELKEKGEQIKIEKLPLVPLRDVRKMKGNMEDLLRGSEYKNAYVSVTVTDEVEPYNMRERLEARFPYLLEVRVDNLRTRTSLTEAEEDIDISSPIETFASFFKEMQGRDLTEQERNVLQNIMEESEG
mgnify:CR=1 FL=1